MSSPGASSATRPPPTGATSCGLFLTAMSVLMVEVAITRVFAITMWHHFAYMVISLALLGFGASGSLLTAFPIAERARSTAHAAGTFASLYGLAIFGVFFAVTRIRVDSLELWNEPVNALGLLFAFALLSVPFLLAGFAIGTTLSHHPRHIGRLYFVDLCGSALGGALAPQLLDTFGCTATVMIAGALGTAGGMAYLAGAGLRRFALHASLAVAAAAAAAVFAGGWLSWKIPFAPHKDVTQAFPGQVSETVIPSAVAQVDVSLPKIHTMVIGGQFGDRDWSTAEVRGVTQDGTAPTAMYRDARNVKSFKALDDSQAASGYVALRAQGRPDLDVMVVGCGGGVDVMTALYFDARSVTAVDINKAMIRMVTKDYADYIGRLFDDPRVRLEHAEGRSYLRREHRKFDLVQLSGVDTFTALSTGAYTLSESYLYTVEAVQDFYTHLEEGGILNYSRFLLIRNAQNPGRERETIRLANIVREALERLGVPEPWRHVVVLQAHGWASTMVRKGPFSDAEIEALRRFVEEERFSGLVFDPMRPRGGPYDPGRIPNIYCEVLARNGLKRAAQELLKRDADEVAAPFLPEVIAAIRLGVDGDLAGSDAALRTFAAKLTSDADTQKRFVEIVAGERDAYLAERPAAMKYFQEQQHDFEVVIRGSAEERARFVADYDFDLTPSTDDRPFFFDYFRLGRFFRDVKKGGDWKDEYHPSFPVGHLVLGTSLLQIAVLAALLILLPLRRLRRRGLEAPRRLRTFLYFGALGLGFMFIEIALMQRFSLFLGHPTLALSVVLSGMLGFSGLGALWSGRVAPGARAFRMILLVLVAIIATEVFVLNAALEPLLGLATPLRVLVTLAFLAPVGFVLGMPFPLGVRLLEANAPALIPWAWAVNGFLSVFASLAAIVLAMQVGFITVMLVATGIYAIGLLAAPLAPRRVAAAPLEPVASK